MSKFASLFIIALLLCFSLSSAARPDPSFKDPAVPETQIHGIEGAEKVEKDENCLGSGEEVEECLKRRTLAAHIDYIYTQNHKP